AFHDDVGGRTQQGRQGHRVASDVEGRGLDAGRAVRVTDAQGDGRGRAAVTHGSGRGGGEGIDVEAAERRDRLDIGDVRGRIGDELVARRERQVGTREVGVGD